MQDQSAKHDFCQRQKLCPIVDKPLIQYAAEEAIAASIDTLIFVTGRNKRAIEDYFDNNQESEFAYCDSGMIPWLLIAELMSRAGRSLDESVKNRIGAFPSSGEINFKVSDAGTVIEKILSAYRVDALSIDETDGVSLPLRIGGLICGAPIPSRLCPLR